MIIQTVLGCVSVAFAWMLQYQNGGLLNVIMKPVRSPDSPNVTFDIISDFSGISTKVMNIVWGKLTKADLAVLEALPTDLGGGKKGVAEAIAHPNNEGKLIVTFIVCLVFASLGLVAIFVVSLICCCCCSSGSRCNDSSTGDQNFLCCGLHILAFLMTALLLLGLAVCIGYYFGAANVVGETLADSKATDDEVIVWLKGNSSSFSIGRTVEFIGTNVEKFAKTSIQSAKSGVTGTVNTLKVKLLEVTLPQEINSLLEALMAKFHLMDLLKTVNELVDAISNATENSNTISNNYNSTVIAFAKNSTELNIALKEAATCKGVTDAEIKDLRNNYNMTNVLPVPLEVVAKLSETKVPLQELKSKMDEVRKKLNDTQENVMTELKNKLNLEQILDGMNSLMESIEEQLNQVTVQMNAMTGKVSGYLGEYSGTAKAVIYALCLPCLLAGILFIVYLALYLFGALKRHLFSLTGTSAAEANGDGISQSRVGGGGMFCICSALLLVPIIMVGLVAVVTITVGGLLHAELCPYIANSSGIRMTDYVLNSKIAVIWKDLIPFQISEEDANGGNNFAAIVNLKAPQNPLYAINIGCNPQNSGPTSKSGLLVQMGIENLVNISALLESPILTDGIDNAKKSLVSSIAGANLGDKIPEKPITDLKAIFMKVFAVLNISQTGEYMRENLFTTDKIKDFANTLDPKCKAEQTKLLALLPTLESRNAASKNLSFVYDGLHNNTMALNLTKLEAVIKSFKVAVADEPAVKNSLTGPLNNFTDALIGSVNATGNEAFTNLTQSLLACDSLHYAVQSVVFMSCGASGLAPRIFAWGLFLSLCLFFTFFSLLSLFMLWRLQNHQVKRFSGSVYSDKDDDNWSE